MKLLWLNHEPGTQARRVEVLLGCFDLSSSSEELQAVESPFQGLCCLLAYLFVQVTWAPCVASQLLSLLASVSRERQQSGAARRWLHPLSIAGL